MNDSSNIVESQRYELSGVHNLQPWYPPLYGMRGPRNVDVVQSPAFGGFGARRSELPAPLTVPYYRYHLSPLFPACAFGGSAQACHAIYGDFIATYENDDLHGATR